jgi:hypothetical protein
VINCVSGARKVPLSGEAANTAERLRAATGVFVVDATVDEPAHAELKPVVILSWVRLRIGTSPGR